MWPFTFIVLFLLWAQSYIKSTTLWCNSLCIDSANRQSLSLCSVNKMKVKVSLLRDWQILKKRTSECDLSVTMIRLFHSQTSVILWHFKDLKMVDCEVCGGSRHPGRKKISIFIIIIIIIVILILIIIIVIWAASTRTKTFKKTFIANCKKFGG